MTAELDRRIVRSTAWVALSHGGSQAISLVVLTILAHLLAPAEFGLVSLAGVVIVVVSYLQESGLGMAVIRQRENLERAVGTAWLFMMTASVVLYAISFALAPVLARVFDEPGLTDVLRVLALMLVIRAAGSTAGALLERDLAFRSRAVGELTGAAVQAAVAIPLAFAGFGVWSLVFGQLASTAAYVSVFFALAPMRPNPRLASWSMLRELARFGRHITIGNILGVVNSTVDNVVIGKLLGTSALGFYAMAWRVANLPAQGLSYIVGRVMFPAYATVQDDLPAFRRAFLLNLQRVAFVSLPVALGIVICADPIITGLFGEKWEPAVTPLRILGVFGLIRSFSGTSGAVFQAAGRPQLVYQIGLVHAAVLYAALFVMAPRYGISGVAGAMTLAAFSSLVPAAAFTGRILRIEVRQLASVLASALYCSTVVGVGLVVIAASVRSLDSSVQLAIVFAGGAMLYGGSLLTFGRADVRTITAAFRSPTVTES